MTNDELITATAKRAAKSLDEYSMISTDVPGVTTDEELAFVADKIAAELTASFAPLIDSAIIWNRECLCTCQECEDLGVLLATLKGRG